MKKNTLFVTIVILLAVVVVGPLIYFILLGAPANFSDPSIKEHPTNWMGMMYTGGLLVPILIGLSIMVVTFVIERWLSLQKAKGRKDLDEFLRKSGKFLDEKNLDAVMDLCDQQKGSVANILRAGVSRFKGIQSSQSLSQEEKIEEVKKSLDEVTMLETPLMEQNLVILSTIASIATMVGLLGTVIGMIKAFAALGSSGGGAAASQLSIAISEALFNTALGIGTAILAIIFYNFYTTKVDKFMYMIDEASLNLLESLKTRFASTTA
ncbi:MAG TPA: MotA/TolQ/ExbB proton channel family protein [Candidatus Kapabacteria bacterium]|nr:MotA/TolQ/ExbB proton channel family protein [Candidatus Kapabacteria bacterium]